jgi:hypothetical protein
MSDTTRRRLLQSILAAPALAGLTPALRAFANDDPLIDSPSRALDIFDRQIDERERTRSAPRP